MLVLFNTVFVWLTYFDDKKVFSVCYDTPA